MKPRLRPRFFIACDLPAPDSAFVGRLATELVHALSGRFGFRGGLVLFGLGTAEEHAIVGRLPLGFDARLLLAVLVEIDAVGHGSCAGDVDGQQSRAGRPVSYAHCPQILPAASVPPTMTTRAPRTKEPP